MHTITLEINNSEDVEMILLLARRLDCNIIYPKKQRKQSVTKSKNNTKEILTIFKELSSQGNIKKLVPNPVAWQKEIRKDRKLSRA